MLLACGQCPSSSVGQSSTVLTSWSRDRGPPRARPYAALVQSGARRPFKPEVTGSSPVRGTYCHLSEVAQLVEQAAVNRKVGGSRPSLGAIHDHLAPIGRRMKVAQALLLNASYEPIHLVSVRRAVLLVLRQKAEVVEESDKVIRSETLTIPVPSVIRLVHFVRIPYQATAKLSHKALVARDHGRCGYCGGRGETMDHIVPRSRGGKTEWKNVVLACKACNHRKADKLLSETKMVLHVKAYAPKGRAWLVVAVGIVDPRWEPYLDPSSPVPAIKRQWRRPVLANWLGSSVGRALAS